MRHCIIDRTVLQNYFRAGPHPHIQSKLYEKINFIIHIWFPSPALTTLSIFFFLWWDPWFWRKPWFCEFCSVIFRFFFWWFLGRCLYRICSVLRFFLLFKQGQMWFTLMMGFWRSFLFEFWRDFVLHLCNREVWRRQRSVSYRWVQISKVSTEDYSYWVRFYFFFHLLIPHKSKYILNSCTCSTQT